MFRIGLLSCTLTIGNFTSRRYPFLVVKFLDWISMWPTLKFSVEMGRRSRASHVKITEKHRAKELAAWRLLLVISTPLQLVGG